MSMTRLYTGPDGQSHLEDVDPASRRIVNTNALRRRSPPASCPVRMT